MNSGLRVLCFQIRSESNVLCKPHKSQTGHMQSCLPSWDNVKLAPMIQNVDPSKPFQQSIHAFEFCAPGVPQSNTHSACLFVSNATLTQQLISTSQDTSTLIQTWKSPQRWISYDRESPTVVGILWEEWKSLRRWVFYKGIRSLLKEALGAKSNTEHESKQRDGQNCK